MSLGLDVKASGCAHNKKMLGSHCDDDSTVKAMHIQVTRQTVCALPSQRQIV